MNPDVLVIPPSIGPEVREAAAGPAPPRPRGAVLDDVVPVTTPQRAGDVRGAERWCRRCSRYHPRVKVAPPGQRMTPRVSCGMVQGQDGRWRSAERA